MAANDNFKWHRPPFLLTPYTLRDGLYRPEDLVVIYNRLKEEDLWDTVFHDNPQMNLLDFMEFFSMPSVMLQIINIADGETISDMAALAWLSGTEQFGTKQRAVANFCVFKDYQSPVITDSMAKFIFSYWFDCLQMDIVVGMTPAANVSAVNFIHRIGFNESCRIPNYSYFRGMITDCVISYMDKEGFQKSRG